MREWNAEKNQTKLDFLLSITLFYLEPFLVPPGQATHRSQVLWPSGQRPTGAVTLYTTALCGQLLPDGSGTTAEPDLKKLVALILKSLSRNSDLASTWIDSET